MLYYSPGVGLIKSTTYRANASGGTRYVELTGTQNITYEEYVDTTQAE